MTLKLQGHKLPAVCEENSLASDGSAHHVGDKNLAAVSLGGDTAGQDDRRGEEVAVLLDRFAGVKPDAGGERFAND